MTKSTIAWMVASIAFAAALVFSARWYTSGTSTIAPPPVAQGPESAPPAISPPSSPKIEHPIGRVQAEAGSSTPATLESSDLAMRDALASLFEGKLPAFVQPTNLIRNIVATIDNLPRSKAAPRLWPVQPTSGALTTINAGDNLVIAADNSTRYAPVVAR